VRSLITILFLKIITCVPLGAQVTFKLCSEFRLHLDAVIQGGQGSWYLNNQWLGFNQAEYTVTDTGAFVFELIATSNNGCISTTKKLVEIIPCDSFYFYIPNAFTPNDDGLNDEFQPIGNITKWHMEVFDQWGSLIYSGDKPWKGNGIADLYAFKLSWRQNGAFKQYIGRVQIVM
jgi:gliding motility-associated-like protein